MYSLLVLRQATQLSIPVPAADLQPCRCRFPAVGNAAWTGACFLVSNIFWAIICLYIFNSFPFYF